VKQNKAEAKYKMSVVEHMLIPDSDWSRTDRLERQMKDYVAMILKLVWQRQAIFFGAIILTAFYFDPTITFACYACILFTEVADLILARRIVGWRGGDPKKARLFLAYILGNTVLSALGISSWVILVVHQQGVGGHFMPLFFLFAAALFAAVNNHQVVPALIVRLSIYGATFFYIALRDLYIVQPPLDSELWLNFFTIVFVLYFIIDCSFVFLRLYRRSLKQFEDLTLEHERTKVAYEAKTQFLSTVSHELRTPLTSIKGSLELVNSGALGEVQERIDPVLRIAGRNSKRLANLIDDLLDLQKIEAGEMSFAFELLDTCKLVNEAIEAAKGYADGLGMTITADLPDEELLIWGDHSRMLQVFENLMSNALKFSAAGQEVLVKVSATAETVRISVRDWGIGIPKDSDKLVFGAFSQLDSTDQRRVGGTGLGLNITSRIVERHNGIIDYVSKIGEGSTFFVEFDRR
jgi:signal transduction histidine kinase